MVVLASMLWTGIWTPHWTLIEWRMGQKTNTLRLGNVRCLCLEHGVLSDVIALAVDLTSRASEARHTSSTQLVRGYPSLRSATLVVHVCVH